MRMRRYIRKVQAIFHRGAFLLCFLCISGLAAGPEDVSKKTKAFDCNTALGAVADSLRGQELSASSVQDGIRAYRSQIHTEVEGRAPGELVRRTSGQYKLKNTQDKEINITFIGTTHEWEGNSASPQEITFIRKAMNIEAVSRPKVLFVEQGNRFAENNFDKKLLDLVSVGRIPSETADKIRQIVTLSENDELATTARSFKEKGGRVINVDLVNNLDALSFMRQRVGEEGAIQFGCLSLTRYRLSATEAEAAFRALIGEAGLNSQFDSARIHQIFKDYYPRVTSDALDFKFPFTERTRLIPNRLRDEFMAMQIANSNENAYFLSATAHTLGVQYHLGGRITHFTPGPEEVSEGRMTEWRAFTPQDLQSIKRRQAEEPSYY